METTSQAYNNFNHESSTLNLENFDILTIKQYLRLKELLLSPVSIHSNSNSSPTLSITPCQLIQRIKYYLQLSDFFVRAVKLNGSTASCILRDVGNGASSTRQHAISSLNNLEHTEIDSGLHSGTSSPQSESSTELSDAVSVSSSASSLSDSDREPTNIHSLATTLQYLAPYYTIKNINSMKLSNSDTVPTDLDIFFEVALDTHTDFTVVKEAVINSLLDFLPESKDKMIHHDQIEMLYIRKRIRIMNGQPSYNNTLCDPKLHDTWSLLSLNNNDGKNIDIKFVSKNRRPYEFSVDSFQIHLDLICDHLSESMSHTEHCLIRPPVSVSVESIYGSFAIAMEHLNNNIIETKRPEEIRGGGLLKYCNLLERGFTTHSVARRNELEKVMCTRFFIDFCPTSDRFQKNITSYIEAHYPISKYLHVLEVRTQRKLLTVINFLKKLLEVVERSATCLSKVDMHQARQKIAATTLSYNILTAPSQQYNLGMYGISPHSYIPTNINLTGYRCNYYGKPGLKNATSSKLVYISAKSETQQNSATKGLDTDPRALNCLDDKPSGCYLTKNNLNLSNSNEDKYNTPQLAYKDLYSFPPKQKKIQYLNPKYRYIQYPYYPNYYLLLPYTPVPVYGQSEHSSNLNSVCQKLRATTNNLTTACK